DNGEANAAIALLERGEMRNPREFNYPFLQGLIRFLSRSDYLGAAACFERALTKPIVEHAEQPRFARTMAARMYQEAGQDDLALNLWRALEAQSREAMVIEIARRNIQRIQAERRHARARVFGRRKKTH
ncbi:MAG: hypothetical protein VKP62_01220, partial [Candidatus Sericytochromatia bacterium]|nr:hypothetical protein [Candidatus Sericytochromatia bacterium]